MLGYGCRVKDKVILKFARVKGYKGNNNRNDNYNNGNRHILSIQSIKPTEKLRMMVLFITQDRTCPVNLF